MTEVDDDTLHGRPLSIGGVAAARYRCEARRLRLIAASFRYADLGAALLEVAAGYELLARQAEAGPRFSAFNAASGSESYPDLDSAQDNRRANADGRRIG